MIWVSGHPPLPGLAGLTCSRPALSVVAEPTAVVTLVVLGLTQFAPESSHRSAGITP
jgi:hypothetical protein